MNNFEHLEWDSNFFELKIGRMQNDESLDLNSALNQRKKEKYKLIYLFSEAKVETVFPLVDEKVNYEYLISELEKETDLEFYPDQTVSPQLLKLAMDSGIYSRFKLDNKFPSHKFTKLYTLWIENSVNKTFADDIIIIKKDQIIAGMVTVKTEGGTGRIGLIAVDGNFRGQDIGTQLLNKCKTYFKQKNCSSIEVPTQLQNKGACNFYEKNGFKIKSISHIYHCWL